MSSPFIVITQARSSKLVRRYLKTGQKLLSELLFWELCTSSPAGNSLCVPSPVMSRAVLARVLMTLQTSCFHSVSSLLHASESQQDYQNSHAIAWVMLKVLHQARALVGEIPQRACLQGHFIKKHILCADCRFVLKSYQDQKRHID